MNKKDDLPAMPFYFGDWRKAPEIRALDLDVRMIWFEMLGLMWESTERGYLTLNGRPVITPVISKMIGVDITVLEGALSQMEEFNVFSRRGDGAIYSRKMVRDEEVRRAKSLAGKKGMKKRWKNSVTGSEITPVITETVTNPENENEIINKKVKQKKIKEKRLKEKETEDFVNDEGIAWYNQLRGMFKSSRYSPLQISAEIKMLLDAGLAHDEIRQIRVFLGRYPPGVNGKFSWAGMITYPGRLLERRDGDERNPMYYEQILQETGKKTPKKTGTNWVKGELLKPCGAGGCPGKIYVFYNAGNPDEKREACDTCRRNMTKHEAGALRENMPGDVSEMLDRIGGS